MVSSKVFTAVLCCVGVMCYVAGRFHALMNHCPVVSGGANANSELQSQVLGQVLHSLKSDLKVMRDSIKANLSNSVVPAQDVFSAAVNAEAEVETPIQDLKEVVSLASGHCLDHNPFQYQDLLMTWECHRGEGGPYQFFRMNSAGQLQNEDGSCVDGTGLKGDQNVRVTKCAPGRKGQLWTYAVHSPHSGYLRNQESGLCMEEVKSTNVVMAPCGRACAQMWGVSRVEDGAPQELVIPPKDDAEGDGSSGRRLGGRVLCWVLTQPAAHATKAVAVNNTWGRDCDILLFASTEKFPGLQIVELDLGAKESRTMLWPKSQQMWMHLYSHYLDKADWFMKADDDTYVVFPYLREYLATMDPAKPISLGRRLHLGGGDDSQAFYSGGAGIVLSRESLTRLGKKAEQDASVWEGPLEGPEDYLTSRTLRKVEVFTQDTRDKDGRHQFLTLGLDPEHTYTRTGYPSMWLWKYSKDAREGFHCCSTRWISTHYINANQMYAIDRLRRSRCKVNVKHWPYLELPELRSPAPAKP